MDYDCNGEREMCDDLLGFRVEEVRTFNDRLIDEKCGRDITACAKVNFTTGECIIYMPKRTPREVRMHERNHCRGWAHPDYDNATWFPMEDPRS